MDDKQVTAEWIAKQRQISEIVNMTYEDAPGSVVPLLKQLEKSQTAALDALEASMQREAEKDAEIKRFTHDYATSTKRLIDEKDRLTAERDAAHAKLLQICRYALAKQEETAFDELFSAMWDIRQIAMAPDAPTGSESAENAQEGGNGDG